MYPFHDALYRLDWGFRQHAVAEIEDVPGAACGALEHVAHPLLELGERREQRHWIEVPLDRPSGADPLPGGVERHTPVHTDYVAPGAGEGREKRGGVGAEVDHRDGGRARTVPRPLAVRKSVSSGIRRRGAADHSASDLPGGG